MGSEAEEGHKERVFFCGHQSLTQLEFKFITELSLFLGNIRV